MREMLPRRGGGAGRQLDAAGAGGAAMRARLGSSGRGESSCVLMVSPRGLCWDLGRSGAHLDGRMRDGALRSVEWPRG